MKRLRQVPAQARRRVKKDPVFLKVVFLIVCVLFVWDLAGPYGFARLYMLYKEKQKVEVSNREKTALNTQLLKEIEKIKTDPALQEQYVRTNLQWVGDDEILYRFK